MKLLSIDYGRKKVGLATSEGKISEPWMVLKYENTSELIDKIASLLKDIKPEVIIIGISEGEMADETKAFGEKLGKKLNLEIKYQDETLSTQMAQKLSIQAKIGRKKRRRLEDAYSAAIILQTYLDSLYNN